MTMDLLIKTLKGTLDRQNASIKTLQLNVDTHHALYKDTCRLMNQELLVLHQHNSTMHCLLESLVREMQDLKSSSTDVSCTSACATSTTAVSVKQECETVSLSCIEPKDRMEFEKFLKCNRLCIFDLCRHYGICEEFNGSLQPIVCSTHHTYVHCASLRLRHPYGYSKFAALYQATRAKVMFKDTKVVSALLEAILNDNELFSELAHPCE